QATNQRIWESAIHLDEPDAWPARMYLARRGITHRAWQDLYPVLRMHPRLALWETDKRVGFMPGLVARVTDAAGKPLTLHRIYLSDRGGKAAIEEPKKMRPYPSDREFTGAHIRLGPTRPIIGIAEGVETALAGRMATGLSVWSGIFDSGVANFLPPEDVAGVVVFA